MEKFPAVEELTFLRYEENSYGETVAIFKAPSYDQEAGPNREVGFNKSDLARRLENLKNEGLPYDKTELALNDWRE